MAVKQEKPGAIARPWWPAKAEYADYMALKALAAGNANEGQQARVLAFFHALCGTDDFTYIPDSERDSDFAQGKRFVGLQIRKFVEMDNATVERMFNK